MSTQKETRSPAATGRERVRENLYTGDNTTSGEKAQSVERLLRHGEHNATSTKELVALSGVGNARALQAQIASEREAGALILSTVRGGYFLPSLDPEHARIEIEAYIKTLRSRATSTLRILKAAKRSLNTRPAQLRINGWGDSP